MIELEFILKGSVDIVQSKKQNKTKPNKNTTTTKPQNKIKTKQKDMDKNGVFVPF